MGCAGVVCENCEDRRQQHCQTSKSNEKTEKQKMNEGDESRLPSDIYQ